MRAWQMTSRPSKAGLFGMLIDLEPLEMSKTKRGTTLFTPSLVGWAISVVPIQSCALSLLHWPSI